MAVRGFLPPPFSFLRILSILSLDAPQNRLIGSGDGWARLVLLPLCSPIPWLMALHEQLSDTIPTVSWITYAATDAGCYSYYYLPVLGALSSSYSSSSSTISFDRGWRCSPCLAEDQVECVAHSTSFNSSEFRAHHSRATFLPSVIVGRRYDHLLLISCCLEHRYRWIVGGDIFMLLANCLEQLDR